MPNQLEKILEEPKKYREWEKVSQIMTMKHEMVVSRKRDAFLLFLLSLVFTYVSYYLNQTYLFYASIGIVIISLIYYIRMLLRHRQLLKRGFKS